MNILKNCASTLPSLKNLKLKWSVSQICPAKMLSADRCIFGVSGLIIKSYVEKANTKKLDALKNTCDKLSVVNAASISFRDKRAKNIVPKPFRVYIMSEPPTSFKTIESLMIRLQL